MTSASVKKQFVDNQVKAFSESDSEGMGLINKHHIVIKMIHNHADKNARILDVGCSEGQILYELERDGYSNLYGVDIQEISKTSFFGSKINYKYCDVEVEPIPFKNKFDIIIVSDVLEHMFSPQSVLYDLKKNLSPQGKIIFSVPNAGWFINGILLTFFPSKLFASTAFGPWGHTYQFTFYQVKQIANNLHYKVLDLKGGKLDNYAFRGGIKKIIYDTFAFFSIPLIRLIPSIFSAHIFGVLQTTNKDPIKSARFDLGL